MFLHPETAGAPMRPVPEGELLAGRGLSDDPRYATRAPDSGASLRRQLTLMAQEEMTAHAAGLGLTELPSGSVRANIETSGIVWRDWVGQRLRVGDALIEVQELRTPCAKMDAVAPGLRAAMGNGRQGVIAAVLRSGRVRRGDSIAAA